MEKNCPNCGAPTDGYLSKCPYCQTYIYDFSELELYGKPIFLRLRDKENIIVIPVVCTSLSMKMRPQEVSYLGITGEPRVRGGCEMEIEACFDSVHLWGVR